MDQFEGRFTESDNSLFPAISNYNFLDNKLYRGLVDTSFRFEDVSIKSVYLYRELTTSGSFEFSNYTGHRVITNYTGVNYITDSTKLVDPTGFNGWTITGGYTLWLGISGAFYTGGSLSGLTGAFRADPVTNDVAIGLYNHSTVSLATIISKSISTGIELINTGVCQFYSLVRCNYSTGSGEYLRATVRGWNSNTVVSYYNPHTYAWELSIPSGFYIPNNSYKEIKYNLETVDFPAATPTGYDVFVQLLSTGGFVTVDDLHLDSRLKKNAFQDYVLPEGYILELTPDLGWHNILDMFSDDGESNNPYLKTIGPFSESLGNLTDNLDNTVTVTIDPDIYENTINNRYTKYLWRAIAVSTEGTLGLGGLPAKFNYVNEEVFSKFSITSVSSKDGYTKIIIGTKSDNSIILVDGQESINTEYPTSNTWKVTLYVNDIKRTVKLQASYNGALSSIKYIELTNTVFEQNQKALWNVFDEHGLLMDLERLPDEPNEDYRTRIKDVYRNRGGSSFQGIVNGATRELGLSKISNALSFKISQKFDIEKHPTVSIQIDSTELKITYNNLLYTETVHVDPIYKTIDLSLPMVDIPINCTLDNGKSINTSDIQISTETHELPHLNRLKILDPECYDKDLVISYNYYMVYNFKDYPTLGSLVDAINISQIVDCEMSDLLAGNEDSLGLFISNDNISRGSTFNVEWSPIFLKNISDRAFREFKRDTVNYKNSKFYKYVSQLKSNSRVLWGSVEADRDYWDAANRTDLSFEHLPTLMDPPLSEFYTTLDGVSTRIESVESWARGYSGYNSELMKNLGISNIVFQPGVAYGNSLMPTYQRLESVIEPNKVTNNISFTQLDNSTTIFSGQR